MMNDAALVALVSQFSARPATLGELTRSAAVSLGQHGRDTQWLAALAAGGVHDVAQLRAIRQQRHLWHRLAMPVAAKLKLEELIAEEDAKREEAEAAEAAALAAASKKLSRKSARASMLLQDENGRVDRRLSFLSSTVVDMLEQDDDEPAPAYEVPVGFGQLTKEEMLSTASLIGMNVDAGAIDRVTPAHEAEAATEGCSFEAEDLAWMDTVLQLAQVTHARAVVRLYICRPSDRAWIYAGHIGGAAVVTETSLQLVCAHYIRLIDLEGWNPSSSILCEQEFYPGLKYSVLAPTFHAFEMNTCIAGFSFANEIEATRFHDAVQNCIATDPLQVIETEMAKGEKSYILNGAVHTADDADQARIMQQAAQVAASGDIIDGIQLKWKKTIPPEMLAVLGASMDTPAPGAPSSTSAAPPGGGMWKKNVTELTKNPSSDDISTSKRKSKRASGLFGFIRK